MKIGRTALAILGLLAAAGGCNRWYMVSERASPQGRMMHRIDCSQTDNCEATAAAYCGGGFRAPGVDQGDSGRFMWFRCLNGISGHLRASTAPDGRDLWIDECDSKADCLSDAGSVCDEGYDIAWGDSGLVSTSNADTRAFATAGSGFGAGRVMSEDETRTSVTATAVFRCRAPEETEPNVVAKSQAPRPTQPEAEVGVEPRVRKASVDGAIEPQAPKRRETDEYDWGPVQAPATVPAASGPLKYGDGFDLPGDEGQSKQ